MRSLLILFFVAACSRLEGTPPEEGEGLVSAKQLCAESCYSGGPDEAKYFDACYSSRCDKK